MTKDNKLTDEKYWHEFFFDCKDFFNFSRTPYARYYEKYINEDPSKKCIEIGAYPGGNLGYLAKKFKYIPVALDFHQNIGFIKANMEYNQILNCELIFEDFIKWEPVEQYDIVCSHGFVEHFIDYTSIINKHMDILKPGGILIITVPYLEFFQLWLRKILYKKEHLNSILASHNRKIMDLNRLNHIVFSGNKFEKLFSGYIRGMTVWFSRSPDILDTKYLWLYDLIKSIERKVNKLDYSNRFISPEILIIAKKINENSTPSKNK